MRSRLILSALISLSALTACQDRAPASGPERASAAGEVLGGEISDEMLPLDTARSTSPAGRSGPAEADGDETGGEAPRPAPAGPRETPGAAPAASDDAPAPAEPPPAESPAE